MSRANQVRETLYEDTIGGIKFRVWISGAEPIMSSELETLLKNVRNDFDTVAEMADGVAAHPRVAAVQVRRKGAKFSSLIYNDWP